tara:strand:+ start:175 stop:588 length:414 start_codon:yes stop_codon:yes gene_type:complete
MAKKQNYVKQELVNLLQSLQAVENLKGVKLAIAIQRNYKIIGNALQDIEEKAIPSEDFMKLADHMRTFDMEKDIEKVKEEEAKPENAKLIEERKKQLDEVNVLLKEDIELALAKIAEKDLPSEITGKQLASIELIIK